MYHFYKNCTYYILIKKLYLHLALYYRLNQILPPTTRGKEMIKRCPISGAFIDFLEAH